MARNALLIENDQPHAKHFQIRLENFRKHAPVDVEKIAQRRLRQKIRIIIGRDCSFFAQGALHSFFLRMISFTSLSNAEKEYSSFTFGKATILYVPRRFLIFSRYASRKSRLILFLCTLFPCFFPTDTAKKCSSAGRYKSVRLPENARFPFLKSCCISVCFFSLLYSTFLPAFRAFRRDFSPDSAVYQ